MYFAGIDKIDEIKVPCRQIKAICGQIQLTYGQLRVIAVKSGSFAGTLGNLHSNDGNLTTKLK